jgi:hypothetical protein
MPQLTAMKGATASGLVLVDAERYQMRVMISYAL